MKVPLSWIREFVDIPLGAEEIGERMSLRGLALEGIERIGDEDVIDFDVTSNRPDCLSVIGIAREVSTAFGLPCKAEPSPGASDSESPGTSSASNAAPALPISIDDPDLCARYVGAVADVTIGPSPSWMQARLRACGVRPISNVVDITNYVLLEMGQPMHAFDLARLAGPSIVVRRARPGEPLTTLDGKPRTLDERMLVIADAERAVAIAGVMGGADSEVTDGTQAIVFESAWFKPQGVRPTSRRLGLRTEASYRFERGGDLTVSARAMTRALQLLESIGAGRARGPIVDCYPAPAPRRELTLDLGHARRLLGMDVPASEAERILRSLGFGVLGLGGWQAAAPDAATTMGRPAEAWRVSVPGWRVDVHRAVDLVEEVGRHYGFEHLPPTLPVVEQAPQPSDPRVARDARVRRAMLAMGFSEAVTFAFVETASAAPYLGGLAAVTLSNPLSEKFTTLRPSLIGGLLDAVSHNRRHGRTDVQLFEIGTRFSPTGETRGLGAIWTGRAVPDHWSGGARPVDFFDIKGVAEQLCELMRVTAVFSPSTAPYLVEGRAGALMVGGTPVGVLGQLDPALAAARDLTGVEGVYVFEADLDALAARAPSSTRFVTPLPRHPSVLRDVAILVDDSLSAETVRGTIRAAAPATLSDVREFDRYQGTGIPDGKVSLALRLTFQAPDRTLTDAEVHAAMDGIVGALTRELGAVQR